MPLALRRPAAARLPLPPREFRLTEALGIARAVLARAWPPLARFVVPRRRANANFGGGWRATRRPTAGIGLRARRKRTVRRWENGRLVLDLGSGKILAGQSCDPFAQLITQGSRLHLLDRAFREIAEPKRTERNPDQTVHRQS